MSYEHRVKMKWNLVPKTEYIPQLDKLNVELVHAPTYEELLNYIPSFGEATWEDVPRDDYTEEERVECVRDMFEGKYVPTAMETPTIIVRITGIDIADVTHLIRHRSFSFSAQCTGDRDMRDDPILMKESILVNEEFCERFKHICNLAKELYADMLDSREVSILDARSILPRSTETYYYVKGPLNAWVSFIKARSDIQIQPKSDVVMAMKVYELLCDMYPPMRGTIDIAGPDWWYINTVNTKRSSNMMYPRPVNRPHVKEAHPDDFVYEERTVGDFPGDQKFLDMLDKHSKEYGPKGK